MTYEDIVTAVRASGLASRGGFHPSPEDGVPALGGGEPAATVVLLGNVGPASWEAFAASPERERGGRHPLDAWSRRVVGGLAEELGATPFFPFAGPPWLPFLRWAQKAEPVWPSPIGPLIHAEYGLWHAYRGALAFADRVDVPARPDRRRPCDTCVDRPCLHTCPVGAFTEGGYDVPRCVALVDSEAGRDCLETGCQARAACPVGKQWRYLPAQAEHHMRAFVRANRP